MVRKGFAQTPHDQTMKGHNMGGGDQKLRYEPRVKGDNEPRVYTGICSGKRGLLL